MKYKDYCENSTVLRSLVIRDLSQFGIQLNPADWMVKSSDKTGILNRNTSPAIPKKENGKAVDQKSRANEIFGIGLDRVPSVVVDEESGPVPKFIAEAVEMLDEHLDVKGLFRRSGSTARLRDLRSVANAGGDLTSADPVDLSCLLKQFFRDLPDCLLTFQRHDAFMSCCSIEDEAARVAAILHLCFLLPDSHFCTLRFLMKFLSRVASRSEINKMEVSNLAICLTPSLFYANQNSSARWDKYSSAAGCHVLHMETSVIELLILQADKIGIPSEDLMSRTMMLKNWMLTTEECSSSKQDVSRSSRKKEKKSGFNRSIKGFVSNLGDSFTQWRKKENQSYCCPHNQTTTAVELGGVLAQPDTTFVSTPPVERKLKTNDDNSSMSTTSKRKLTLRSVGERLFTPRKRTKLVLEAENSTPVNQVTPHSLHDVTLFSMTPDSSLQNINFDVKSGQKSFSAKSMKRSVKSKVGGFLKHIGRHKTSQHADSSMDFIHGDRSVNVTSESDRMLDVTNLRMKKSKGIVQCREFTHSLNQSDLIKVIPLESAIDSKKRVPFSNSVKQNLSLPLDVRDTRSSSTNLRRKALNARSFHPYQNVARKRSNAGNSDQSKNPFNTSPIKESTGSLVDKENNDLDLVALRSSEVHWLKDDPCESNDWELSHDRAFTESMLMLESSMVCLEEHSDEEDQDGSDQIAGKVEKSSCNSRKCSGLRLDDLSVGGELCDSRSNSISELEKYPNPESTTGDIARIKNGRLTNIGGSLVVCSSTGMLHYPSKQSIQSLDSGVGMMADSDAMNESAFDEEGYGRLSGRLDRIMSPTVAHYQVNRMLQQDLDPPFVRSKSSRPFKKDPSLPLARRLPKPSAFAADQQKSPLSFPPNSLGDLELAPPFDLDV